MGLFACLVFMSVRSDVHPSCLLHYHLKTFLFASQFLSLSLFFFGFILLKRGLTFVEKKYFYSEVSKFYDRNEEDGTIFFLSHFYYFRQ